MDSFVIVVFYGAYLGALNKNIRELLMIKIIYGDFCN